MVEAIEKYKESALLTNIGIALSFVGVPLGMYFNNMYPIVQWSPVIMLLSLGFIINYKNLFVRLKLPSFNNIFKYVLLFQLLMLIYGMFSENFTFQLFTFHLYIVGFIIALSSQDININFKRIILIIFYVSSLASILGIYYLASGIVTSVEYWEARQSDNYYLDPFTIASGAIVNFVCLLFLFEERIKLKILLWLFLCVDILVIFMSAKRTPIFVSLIVFFLYLYKMRKKNRRMLKQYLKLFILLILVAILIYLKVELVKVVVDRFVSNFYNGVLNVLGNNDVTDNTGSAIIRYKFRLFGYDYINNKFNFFNYIFGVGYMTAWIDNPIFQSYIDMGILGLLFYLFLVVIYPIKSYFKYSNNLILFAVLICVYNILSSYSSGYPYAYIKYVPIVVLGFMSNLKKEQL